MRKRWFFIVPISICVIGIIIGSFFDLQIAQGIFLKKNPLSLTFASLGENPYYAAMSFLAGGLTALAVKVYVKKWQTILLILAAAGWITVACVLQGRSFCNVNGWGAINPDLYKPYIYLPIGLAIVLPFAVPGYLLVRKNPDPKLLWLSIACLASIAIVAFTVSVVCKPLFVRPRFRWLVEQPNFSDYRNWWERFDATEEMIATYGKEEFRSFPSGHSSAAPSVIFFAYLPYFVPSMKDKKEKYQTIFFWAGVTYMFLLMFTRMLAGAHFLSDVCMGALVGLLLVYIANEIIIHRVYKDEKPEIVEIQKEEAV